MRLFYRYTAKNPESITADASNQILASIDNKINRQTENMDTKQIEIDKTTLSNNPTEIENQENSNHTKIQIIN